MMMATGAGIQSILSRIQKHKLDYKIELCAGKASGMDYPHLVKTGKPCVWCHGKEIHDLPESPHPSRWPRLAAAPRRQGTVARTETDEGDG
jgi:hypothetical protein